MALIACHECAAKISDSAKKCPQCGAPTKKASMAAVFTAITMLALFLLWMIEAASS